MSKATNQETQALLAAAPPERIEEFLRQVRQDWDPINAELAEMIIDLGLTPWRAAKRLRQANTDISLSIYALNSRAKKIERELQIHFGRSPRQWAETLENQGSVRGVPTVMIDEVIRAAADRGLTVVAEQTLYVERQ